MQGVRKLWVFAGGRGQIVPSKGLKMTNACNAAPSGSRIPVMEEEYRRVIDEWNLSDKMNK